MSACGKLRHPLDHIDEIENDPGARLPRPSRDSAARRQNRRRLLSVQPVPPTNRTMSEIDAPVMAAERLLQRRGTRT